MTFDTLLPLPLCVSLKWDVMTSHHQLSWERSRDQVTSVCELRLRISFSSNGISCYHKMSCIHTTVCRNTASASTSVTNVDCPTYSSRHGRGQIFLSRNFTARYCYGISSVRPSVCNVGGLWSHMLRQSESYIHKSMGVIIPLLWNPNVVTKFEG